MASLSPNATLVESLGDPVNAPGAMLCTYRVTTPDGIVRLATFGPSTQERCDNLASMLADGGYLAAKSADHLQPDGWYT